MIEGEKGDREPAQVSGRQFTTTIYKGGSSSADDTKASICTPLRKAPGPICLNQPWAVFLMPWLTFARARAQLTETASFHANSGVSSDADKYNRQWQSEDSEMGDSVCSSYMR